MAPSPPSNYLKEHNITLKFKGRFPNKFTISNFAPLDGLYVLNPVEQKTLVVLAAAPELFETVKELVEVLEQVNSNGMFAYHPHSHTGITVKKANAVIAKATGK